MEPASSSGVKRTSASPPGSSSAQKRPKYDICQQTAFIDKMKKLSSKQMWPLRMQVAEDDNSAWQDVFSDVLGLLTGILATTNVKNSVIALTTEQAEQIVKNFNTEEMKEWKEGVQKGVEKNDWTDLVSHRTYHPVSGAIIIINHWTARLQAGSRLCAPRITCYSSSLNKGSR